MSENSHCHFCALTDDRIIDETETCLVIYDLYPVTPLHTLIITNRHVASYFDLNDQERQDVQKLLDDHKQRISEEDETVSGFNIGINCGEDAGQTVMHCHVHLIPRRKATIKRRSMMPSPGISHPHPSQRHNPQKSAIYRKVYPSHRMQVWRIRKRWNPMSPGLVTLWRIETGKMARIGK